MSDTTKEPLPFGLVAFRASRMHVAAEVAYWAETETARNHHLAEIIRRYDELTPMIDTLRAAMPQT